MNFISAYEDDIFYDAFGMRQWERRHAKVTAILDSFGAKRIGDFGCSEGKFIRRMTRDERYDIIIGMDIDDNALKSAKNHAEPESYHEISKPEKEEPLEIYILKNSFLKDCRFIKDFKLDAITLIEVIEHVYVPELEMLCENVFGILTPPVVIATTPNFEFNVWFENKNTLLEYEGQVSLNIRNGFRHPDHKFEMTRMEFKDWAQGVCEKYGYDVAYDGVGEQKKGDMTYGYCSQVATFTKKIGIEYSSSYKFELQDPEVYFHVKYPYKPKKSLTEKFLDEIHYAYSYSDPLDIGDWIEDYSPQKEDYKFIEIAELLAFRGLSEIVNGKITDFINLVEEGIEFNSTKDKIRIIPKDVAN